MERAQPSQEQLMSEHFQYFLEVTDSIQPQLDAILDTKDTNELIDMYLIHQEDSHPLTSLADAVELPPGCTFLAMGMTSVAIRYTDTHGDYVLRFPRTTDPHERSELVEYRQNTRLWERDAIPNVEEIVALSHSKGVVVTNFIEGAPAYSLSDEDKQKIKTIDLVSAKRAIIRLHQRGLCLDDPSNCLVNPNASDGQRISFIDPLENNNPNHPHTIEGDYRAILKTLIINS